ncbi:MAG: hypothetical protein R3230_00505 [Nitrosopumilaceae archaeon]|nr:hypothetical protein [Nitrosopumilaceae archaeon]
MKTIKDILIESAQMDRFRRARKQKRSKEEEKRVALSDSEIYFRYKVNGWLFKATIHAAAQEYDRRPDMLQKDWKDFHNKVYDKVVKMKPIDGEFIFFSKSWNQAYVATVDFTKMIVKVITVLPKGRSNPKPGTVRMIIEGVEYTDLQTVECD